ncbi:multidrug efflux pump subunit AcrB [Scopulibacillus daqui]|uniref:Multidrug efflux pump subunit AcrB n=1 Tax=Scopulibacillus daqui TaxID=1469162 RepID=A0ABS2Q2W5_9BACL|nr:efflux RND transporter permease subunit [Scopulibacillus daqui]MBM7646636.1 multidrug efflux pump subunit AcrB [Scopulibacillus daqui]
MEKVIHALSKRLPLIILFIVLIFTWGAYSATQMKKEYLPDINNPILMVTLKTDGELKGEKQNLQLSEQLTKALKGVDQLQSVESTIYPQGLFLSLIFPQNIDIKEAEKSIKSELQTVQLPKGVSQPEITRISSDSFPFMKISLTSDKLSNIDLRTTASKHIKKQLEKIQGVEKIQTTGNGEKGYIVNLDNQKLDKYRLSFKDIKAALKDKHISWPNGAVQAKNLWLPLTVEGSSADAETLGNIVVKRSNDKNILLKDVATIQKGIVHWETLSKTNSHPSVLLNLLKTPSADVTKVSQSAAERLRHIPEIKSGNVHADILLNQGEAVSHAIKGVWREGLLGCLFSMICVFFFFREWRSTMAILFSLPICFLTTIAVLYHMGITLNLLTASGLIVAMGRVVDDSIVIMDNMYRKLEQQQRFSLSALTEAVKEMIPAVISSTLTTIAVYIPLAMTGTMVGYAFSGFAWAVAIALICSLIVSLILIPPYAALTWRRRFAPIAIKAEEWAKPIISRLFKRRQFIFGILCIALVLSAVGACFIPVNILPRSHAHDVTVQIECPDGATLDQVDAEVRSFESLLSKHPEIKSYDSTLGSSFSPAFDDVFDQDGGWIQQPNVANVYVTPKKDVSADHLIHKINQDIKQLSNDAVFTVSSQQIAGDDSRVRIVLTGPNKNELIRAANHLKSKMQMIKGFQLNGDADSNDQLRFTVKLQEEKVKRLGLHKEDILNKVRNFLDEREDLNVSIDGSSIPVTLHKPSNVHLAYKQGVDSTKALLTKLGRLTFNAKTGKKVLLADISTLDVEPNAVIGEKDGIPMAVVTGNIITTDIGRVTGEIKQILKDNHFPKGIHVDFGGIPQQVKEMIWSISLAGFLSIILVLIIITSIFKGIRAPLAVISSLPFAFIGSVILLFVFGQSWNLGALAGLVMLIGIVATNGIVLVDRMERLRAQGKDVHSAAIEGAASRFRPVLMTAAATILTLLPLALSRQSDTLISQSLGLVVIGGMITATITSLIIIPTIYQWLYSKRDKAEVKTSLSQ